MPVKKCTSDGKPGYKWGDEGKCYTYDPDDEDSKERAKEKAAEQGRAIKSDQSEANLKLPLRLTEATEPPTTDDEDESEFIAWEADAIKVGMSHNMVFYPADTLQEAVEDGMFEGIPVYDYSESDHAWGNFGVEYLAGYFRNAEFDKTRVTGTIMLMRESHAAKKILAFWEAKERGDDVEKSMPKLSITASGELEVRSENGEMVAFVTAFRNIYSVDVVINAAAGGEFLDRLSESIGGKKQMFERLIEWVRETYPQLLEGVDEDNLTEADLTELIKKIPASVKESSPPPEKQQVENAQTSGNDVTLLRETVHEMQTERKRDDTRRRLAELLSEATTLPSKARERVRQTVELRLVETPNIPSEELHKVIDAERDYLSEAVQPFVGRDNALRGDISVGLSEADRHYIALERMLFGDTTHIRDVRLSEAHKGLDWEGVPAFRSLREAGRIITGEEPMYWRSFADAKPLHGMAIRRMNPDGTVFTESMTTSDFPSVLENILTKRMLLEYARPTLDYWRRLVNVTTVNDLKQQSRLRIGGFGNLPSIAERDSYTDLQDLDETKITFTPSKYGGTADMTLEAWINDDLQALRDIAPKLALAAKRTILEFVEDFITTNPTIYDGNSLFDAVNHSNTSTNGLSEANLYTAWKAMANQTETVTTTGAGSTTKKLHIDPKYLLVPTDLWKTAYQITTPAHGQTNATPEFEQTLGIIPMRMLTLTDDDAWYLLADPTMWDTIEIAFLGGRDMPEIFLQNAETEGEMFARDVMTWKVRWFFGGAVTEYRTFYGGIPA